jgi:hypothetical protein
MGVPYFHLLWQFVSLGVSRIYQERSQFLSITNSVADPDPGSGAFLGSGIRIPKPYFLKLNGNFLGKKFYKKIPMTTNFFLPSLLFLSLDPG